MKPKTKVVGVGITFLRCPNKKHKAMTAFCTGPGAFEGFINPGCSCALEVYLETMRELEKKRRKK